MNKSKRAPLIKAIIHFDHLRVYIDDIIHLSIRLNEIVGIKSYIIGKHHYHIDFYMKDTVIECDYTNKETWTHILRSLEMITII